MKSEVDEKGILYSLIKITYPSYKLFYDINRIDINRLMNLIINRDGITLCKTNADTSKAAPYIVLDRTIWIIGWILKFIRLKCYICSIGFIDTPFKIWNARRSGSVYSSRDTAVSPSPEDITKISIVSFKTRRLLWYIFRMECHRIFRRWRRWRA